MNQQVVDEQFASIKDFINKSLERLDNDEIEAVLEKVEAFLEEKADTIDTSGLEDTESEEDE